MSKDTISGALREGVGKLQDAAGSFVGDDGQRLRGRANEVAGSAQQAYGQARDQAADVYDQLLDFVRDQPFTAAAVGAGLGLVFGLLMRPGRKVVYVRR